VTADDLPQVLRLLPPAWHERLPGWTASAQSDLIDRVRAVSADRFIAPADPFRALRMVAPDAVKVVVIGQDPYPTAGQADGLAFSAERSTRPSLRRVFDALENDRPGWQRPTGGRLDNWARQGVLLLNPVLTVEVGRKESHMSVGWQGLTASVVKLLCLRGSPPVFLLWGSKAQAFYSDAACPTETPPTVLRTRHPSNDFRGDFMRDASHFMATSDLIDWWTL